MVEDPPHNQAPNLSATGAVAPSAGSEAVPLPKFVLRLADGLYVERAAFDSPTLFFDFIDRIFTADLRFVELDYPCLQTLLYQYEPADIKLAQDLRKAGKGRMLRLATDIAVFPPARRQYYRDVIASETGQAVEYLFEPLVIDTEIDEPVYGEPGADGIAPIIEHAGTVVSEQVTLDLDEFIAVMWRQEIRFGIDIAAVRKGLADDVGRRAVIAQICLPTIGQDATVEELVSSLHRDNAPKLLADGRVDLHQFQNRFPQVEKDTRLIRKIPRVPGKPGRDLAGHELAADIPRDVDLEVLAGPGTRVERTAQGEFVVAAIRGFLQIEPASKALSISDKIINREGVSLRTTGNLNLGGDEYEEHGEVEELTQIEGKHMTFMANVFGNIVSHGGRVVLKQNLSAGSVKNPGGEIVVEGSASSASFEAIGGDITLHHAENCLIVGKKVSIAQAIHCDILAEDLTVEYSEGSAMAAQRMHIGTATEWRDEETIISMLIPDLSAFAARLDELDAKHADAAQTATDTRHEIEAITGQPDVKTYSILAAKLRARELNMSREQDANWQKLATRVAPVLRQLKALNDTLRIATSASEEERERIAELTLLCAKMSAGLSCEIAAITGETTVRTLKIRPGQVALHSLTLRELRARLHESDLDHETVFSGSDGAFTWAFAQGEASGGAE